MKRWRKACGVGALLAAGWMGLSAAVAATVFGMQPVDAPLGDAAIDCVPVG